MKSDKVVIWSKGGSELSWAQEVFEVVPGHRDLIRTYLGWYVGEDPRQGNMTLDNSIRSTPDPHNEGLTVDVQTFTGPIHATQTETAQEPVYLASQLAGRTLYVFRDN